MVFVDVVCIKVAGFVAHNLGLATHVGRTLWIGQSYRIGVAGIVARMSAFKQLLASEDKELVPRTCECLAGTSRLPRITQSRAHETASRLARVAFAERGAPLLFQSSKFGLDPRAGLVTSGSMLVRYNG